MVLQEKTTKDLVWKIFKDLFSLNQQVNWLFTFLVFCNIHFSVEPICVTNHGHQRQKYNAFVSINTGIYLKLIFKFLICLFPDLPLYAEIRTVQLSI